MYSVHAFKFLRRKKQIKMYNMRKDFDVAEVGESSEDEEEIQEAKYEDWDNWILVDRQQQFSICQGMC